MGYVMVVGSLKRGQNKSINIFPQSKSEKLADLAPRITASPPHVSPASRGVKRAQQSAYMRGVLVSRNEASEKLTSVSLTSLSFLQMRTRTRTQPSL